jgi:hypothetical protein
VVAVSAGGGSASMYAVQIDSLQTYQKQLTKILQDLQSGQQSKLDHAGTGASVFGRFPEAVSFSTAFESVRRQLVDSFGEITELVEAMIKALGSSASNYQAVEEQIAQQFSAISSQYGYSAGSGSGSSPGGSGTGTTTSTSSGTGTGTGTSTGTGPTYALSGGAPATSATSTTGQSSTSDTADTTDGNASAGALG